jgi:hypothetical protein
MADVVTISSWCHLVRGLSSAAALEVLLVLQPGNPATQKLKITRCLRMSVARIHTDILNLATHQSFGAWHAASTLSIHPTILSQTCVQGLSKVLTAASNFELCTTILHVNNTHLPQQNLTACRCMTVTHNYVMSGTAALVWCRQSAGKCPMSGGSSDAAVHCF